MVNTKVPSIIMEDLRDVIEARADAVIQAEKKAGQREGR